MRKIALVILLGLSINLVSCTSRSIEKENKSETENVQSSLEEKEIEYAENYDFNSSLEKRYFVRRTISDGNNTRDEIHNEDSLAKLVDDINGGNAAELIIIEYLYKDGQYTVNKFKKICYDGNKIIEKDYDTISDKDKFILADTIEYSKISVEDVKGSRVYRVSANGEDWINLESFGKDQIFSRE